jgi:LPXTG-motif cell wall-anchored protein
VVPQVRSYSGLIAGGLALALTLGVLLRRRRVG